MDYHNEIVFTEALEKVERIIASSNGDEIATLIEHLGSNSDLAMSALMIFTFKVKKVAEGVSGVELANARPTGRLYLPPGVNL